jgi:4-hydroxybenzoate polyprenyltransferase
MAAFRKDPHRNWPTVKERLYQYYRLVRLDRPIGMLLLLWPALWALWIAGEGRPDPLVLGVFVAGVVLMRAAGCAINDFADRKIDPHVRRTTQRPLATGQVSPKEALGVFVALSLTAFGLVLLMNRLTILLSFVAVALAAVYPFMKRYTYLPQVVLGAAFGWAVPMAFAAQTGAVPPVAWLLFVATVVWATVYDTFYAMVDRPDDLKIGVKSTAVLFGDADRVIVGALQALLMADLILVGVNASLGNTYYVGLAAAGALALYQQYLIKDREPQRCFQAFLNNNWFGAAVFVGILLDFLWRNGA